MVALSFAQKVYRLVQQIPRGQVATYGQIAWQLKRPQASRAVGKILHHNPRPGQIPCHRVVDRRGRLAAAYAFGGPKAQRSRLAQEGIVFAKADRVALKQYQVKFLKVEK